MLMILKWLALVAIALAFGVLAAGRLGLLAGSRPPDLGVKNGRLKPPSNTPNSVSSQAALYPGHPMQAQAQIAPLTLHGDAAATLRGLQQLVAAQPGASVVEQGTDYLYAQFKTPTLQFVDDVEFWVDPATGVVQLRSASRIGRKDFGVNRARIETLRAQWAAKASGG
jgi:uncharacterized protein (DUF1499 family)